MDTKLTLMVSLLGAVLIGTVILLLASKAYNSDENIVNKFSLIKTTTGAHARRGYSWTEDETFKNELRQGIKLEYDEHFKELDDYRVNHEDVMILAESLARDHIAENATYYTILEKTGL